MGFEGGAEPSPSGESQTRADSINEDGAEPPSSGETHIDIADRDQANPPITNEFGTEPSSTGETQTQAANGPIIGLILRLVSWSLDEVMTITRRRRRTDRRSRLFACPNNTNEGSARDKPLIVHGLEILCELASDPGNCTEICKHTDLVAKIVAPISHGMLKSIGNNDPKTVQIVKESLHVLAKLTSGTGKSSRELRRELLDNGRTTGNILWIKENSDDKEMKILAMKILTRLTLGSAGKAPNAPAADHRDCEVNWGKVGDDEFEGLATLMNADGASTELRAVTAEFLAQICADSRTEQPVTRNRHISVSYALSTVFKATVTTKITDTAERRNFLASFLGLAVQIREKLVTEEAFANAIAVAGLDTMGNSTNNFAEKLKETIFEVAKVSEDEICLMNSEDEICLVITKAAIKLVTWTMGINHNYFDYFQHESIKSKWDAIADAMGGLERCAVLSGDADEMQPYETLKTLVEKVKNLPPPTH